MQRFLLGVFHGGRTPQNTALTIIDMQTNFCCKGGYADASATISR
jgi:nicotinamidase-related amidase